MGSTVEIVSTLNTWGSGFANLAGPMLVQSMVVIAVLLALVWACSRTRAAFRYALLMLVLIKLLLPPSLSLPTGLRYWLRVADVSPKSQRDYAMAVGRIDADTRPGTAKVAFSPDALLLLFWVAGIGVLVALIAGRYRRVALMKGTPAPVELQQEVDACREQVGLKRSLRLELSSCCASPAASGLLRPVILIPKQLAESLNRTQLRHVLLHELAHVKRGDLWVNHLQVTLQVLYWYNPLLWLANALIRRVREEAVDQNVMFVLGREAESYRETLVAVAKLAFAQPSLSMRFIGIMESRATLKRRLARLMQNPVPKTVRLGWLRTAFVLALGAFLLPMARPQSSKVSVVAAPDARRGAENGSTTTPTRFDLTQALLAQGMTFEQFQRTVIGDRPVDPAEFDLLVGRWLMAQASSKGSNIVAKIVIQRRGPGLVAESQIRSKISSKVGAPVSATDLDTDVRKLSATGLFQNIRLVQERGPDGIVLTYVVQEKSRLGHIEFEGNTKIEDGALRQKLASRVGEPMDERKLFTDAQNIQEAYRQLGFPEAVVKYRIKTDEKTGQSAVTFQITLNREGAGAVAPDHSPIVSPNAHREITLWDVATGKPVPSSVYSVAFSPDGQRIVTTNTDGKIRIWDLEKHKETGSPVYSAAFSPDGRLLVTTNSDGSIRVFSPDGQRLGTNQPVYNDPWGNPYIIKGPVRVWDAVTGKEIAPLPKQEPMIENPGVGGSTKTGIMSDAQFADPSTVTGIRSDPQLKQ